MRSFLALMSKRAHLDPELLAGIPALAARALPFRHMPYASATWQAGHGRMALFAWDNDTKRETAQDPIHVTGTRASTLYGYVSHHAVPDPRGPAVPARWLGDDVSHVADAGGMFVACCADEPSATVTVWKSASIAIPAFWVETPELIAVGTRALMLSLLLADGPAPTYDVGSLVPFLARGRFASDRTPFRGVHPLPPNSRFSASPLGVTVQPIDAFESESATIDPSPGDYDILTELLVAGARPFHGQSVTCNLTGGKDSRTVAAVLQHAGLDVSAQTNGFPEHPDVIVAGRVAKVLGIPHRISGGRNASLDHQAAVSVDVHHRARRTLFGADGMLSAYEHLSPASRFRRSPLSAGGHGGEVALRDSFESGGLGWDAVAGVLLRYYLPPSSVFVPGALDAYTGFLVGWVENARARGLQPTATLDLFGYHFDLGVSGVGPIVAEIGRYGLYPLMDNQVVKAGLRAAADAKLHDDLLVNILRRLEPRLLEVPLARKRWNFEQHGPLPGDADGWARRAPVIAPKSSRGAFNWRHHWSRELWEPLIEQIFGDPRADALFEVLDRDAFRHWVDRRRGLVDASGAALAWAAFSASVLLSNAWLEPSDSPRGEVSIPVPVTA